MTMNTSTTSTQHPSAPPGRSILVPALVTAVVTTLALLWATFLSSPWKAEPADWGIDHDAGLVDLLWVVGCVALGVGVVFGVVVRRALAGEPARAARTALVLAVVAAVTVVAFWTGLPIVLGSAAVYLGLDARGRSDRMPVTGGIAIGLGALAAVFALFLCITG